MAVSNPAGARGVVAVPWTSGRDAVWAAVRTHGAVLLERAADSQHAFEHITEALAGDFRVHHNTSRRRFNEDDTTQSVSAGTDGLGLHSERAYLPARPELLFFNCVRPAASGGQTTICDAAAVFDGLPSAIQAALRSTVIEWKTDAPKVVWSRLWKTSDPEELSREIARVLERSGETQATRHAFDGGMLRINFQCPCVSTGWISGREAFANYLLMDQPPNVRSRVAGPPTLPGDWLNTVAAVAQQHTVDVVWNPGDVVVIDNTRWLHGRRAFTDPERLILVRMGDVVPELRPKPLSS